MTGGQPESADELCPDTLCVALKPKPSEKGVLAIAGDWNALPRVPKSQDIAQADYVKAVREFLTAKDIRNPKVKITQILRIDLEGDGAMEVVVNGDYYEAGWITVFRCTPGRIEQVFEVGCGA